VRILIFAEFIYASPWRADAWIGEICGALASRGHEITLACDGGRDLLPLAPFRVIARRPLRTWRDASPLAFSRWARRTALATPHEASLSFTPLAPADAMLPIGGALATLRLLAGALNPLALGLELIHQPWLPIAVAVESSLARSTDGTRLRIGLPREKDPGIDLGYASRLAWSGDNLRAQRQSRARIRRALGIGLRRPVALISAVHPGRPGLDPMLRALAEARAEAHPALAPLALAAGRNAYSIHAAAARAGSADGIRPIGSTGRMAEVIDACDLVIAHGAGTGTGRLVADGLRRGRPVLADRDAPGAELIVPGPHNAYTEPGLIVERRTAGAWREALARALNEDWLEASTRAARETGRTLSMDALAQRLETALGEAARRRSTALSRP
jgi:hypothetical protein